MKALAGLWRSFEGDRRGTVAVLAALLLPVLIGAGAFATDMGVLYVQRRSLQGATDAAVLGALARPDHMASTARRILDEAGWSDATFKLTFGEFALDAPRDERFTPKNEGTALRIEASVGTTFFLARIFGTAPPILTVAADALITPTVSLSVGTRLASVSPPISNAVLGKALGAKLDLQLVDYRGLASARIDLGDLLNGVAKRALGTVGPDTLVGLVLAQRVRLSDLASILSDASGAAGDPVAAFILRKVARQSASSDVSLRLADLFATEPDLERLRLNYPSPALRAKISVLSVLQASLRQNGVGSRLTNKLDLGLATINLDLLIGEAMQSSRSVAVSSPFGTVQSDQVRLQIIASTGNALALLGRGLNLPLEVVAAGGDARVVDVHCGTDAGDRWVKVEAKPGLARISIGTLTAPIQHAHVAQALEAVDLISSPIARVQGRANALVTESRATTLVFRGAEIGNGTIKTARTRSLVSSLVAGTIEKTQVTIRLLGIGLPLLDLDKVVVAAVSAMAEPLDEVTDALLGIAGVRLGEMDVRVDDLVCGHARIVG